MRFGGWLHPLQAGFSGLATGRGCGANSCGPAGRAGDAPISQSFDPCRSSWIKTVRPILRMQGTTTPQLHFDIHPTFWTLTVASMWVAWFDPCGRTPRTVRLSPWCVNARRGLGRTQSYCTRCVWSVVTPDQFRKASVQNGSRESMHHLRWHDAGCAPRARSGKMYVWRIPQLLVPLEIWKHGSLVITAGSTG